MNEKQNTNALKRKRRAASMGLEIALGAALGAAMGNIALGLAVGVILGGVGVVWRK